MLAFALALLATVATAAAPPDSDGSLARQWQQLRALPGHFSGGPWNPPVDAWDGTKHRLMREMAARLVLRRATAHQAQALLGAPDDRLAAGDERHASPPRALAHPCPGSAALREADTWWLYQWRGRRDQLALVMREDRIVACGWLHDWE